MNVRGPGQHRMWNDFNPRVLLPDIQPGTFDEQSESNLQFLLQMGDIFNGMAEEGNQGRGQKGSRWQYFFKNIQQIYNDLK